jgi:phage terminase large subunit-like protein
MSKRLLRNTAEQDGKKARIGFGKDPGQAGKEREATTLPIQTNCAPGSMEWQAEQNRRDKPS